MEEPVLFICIFSIFKLSYAGHEDSDDWRVWISVCILYVFTKGLPFTNDYAVFLKIVVLIYIYICIVIKSLFIYFIFCEVTRQAQQIKSTNDGDEESNKSKFEVND